MYNQNLSTSLSREISLVTFVNKAFPYEELKPDSCSLEKYICFSLTCLSWKLQKDNIVVSYSEVAA